MGSDTAVNGSADSLQSLGKRQTVLAMQGQEQRIAQRKP
jgi:hypothetical protein